MLTYEELLNAVDHSLGIVLFTMIEDKIYILALHDYLSTSITRAEVPSGLAEYSVPQNSQDAYMGFKPERFISLNRTPNTLIHPYELRSGPGGVFYLSDIRNHQIWSITLNKEHTTGELRVLAGSGKKGFRDGTGSEASFYVPSALSLDDAGNLYVADTGNHAIRKVTPEGVVTTFYRSKVL